MKRFVITISCILCAVTVIIACHYIGGVYIDFEKNTNPEFFVRTQGKQIEIYADNDWEEFEIRGIDLSSAMPSHWSTDYAIDYETYMRWFSQMSEMGANTIRVYSIQNPSFYKALDDFNTNADEPIYLLQGVPVNDYVQNSHMDAYDTSFRSKLISDCRAAVDVLHGKRISTTNRDGSASGIFMRDVSKWVLGYMIGSEWTDTTVAYTDEKYPSKEGYEGKYIYTSEEASPFEIMLAEAGDELISYEDKRYGQQRLISFANARSTDPFEYPQEVKELFHKCAKIDVEHICASKNFKTGMFASYSCYAYDSDYLSVMEPSQWQELSDEAEDFSDCNGTDGKFDTYYAYLKLLNSHHSMPVLVHEFGVSCGRGDSHHNTRTGSSDGHISEKEQSELLTEYWRSIMMSGCVGGCIYSWQDEWHRSTWNTSFSVDLSRTPYWHDAQSNAQHFGLLAFDTGKEAAVCTVDGDVSEWSGENTVIAYENGDSVSMKYDEAYIYFNICKSDFEFGKDTIYLALDTTQNSGTTESSERGLSFDRAVDFLVKLHTKEDSELLVQDRYHAIHANYEAETTGKDAYINPPQSDSEHFETEQLVVRDTFAQFVNIPAKLNTADTGILRLGNADPQAEDYDSLTDFAVSDDGKHIELRLPWSMLNFSDPSHMQIHDDYYNGNYGVEFIEIKKIYMGIGSEGEKIETSAAKLKGWGNTVTWHERLKPSYYALKNCWKDGASK